MSGMGEILNEIFRGLKWLLIFLVTAIAILVAIVIVLFVLVVK
jgi:hypothetical protein